jgi:hypothetical protein
MGPLGPEMQYLIDKSRYSFVSYYRLLPSCLIVVLTFDCLDLGHLFPPIILRAIFDGLWL